MYHACMNEPLIEEIGLQPLKDKLQSMGGWPVLEVTLPKQRIWNVIGISINKLPILPMPFMVITAFIIFDMQGGDWKEDDFSWIETTYKFRENSYSTDLLIDFSIGTDIKNSSWRVIDIDQASLLILILIELH